MDNIKKFEDFLDRMQGLLDSAKKQGHIIVRVEDLENTFPELKESKDERIREALIENFKWFCGDYPETSKWGKDDNLLVKDIIAWLEKQGEPTDINPSEFDLRLNKLLKQFETLPKEELASSLSFYLNVVQNDGTYREEKQVEQKSSDKVEPKFKVGDWVVKGDTIAQILDIQEQYYVGLDINGKDFTSSRFLNDDKIHLWTIQDAKDGDVLVSKYNRPFIYNGNRDFFHVGSYCGLSTSDKFIVSTSKCFWTENVSILPATKEQRELLFKEMKEAGYEWDSEHKQLKKIETMDKYEGLTDFERTLTDICIGWIGEEIGWKQYIKDNADILLKIAVEKFNSVQDATFEQKPADWSEEDEEFLRRAIKATKDVYPVTADWLKSLKPQKQWKPTKEQVEALHDMNLTGNISYAGQGKVLIELYNDLKKLKE